MIIDISQEILGCEVYPGDPQPKAEKHMDMGKGDLYNLSAFYMGAHNGTHIDAPAHFIKDGKTVDQLPAESFVGSCYVARHSGDVGENDAISIMKKAETAGAADRILIAGDAVVTLEAAKVFASCGIKLIGNESQSVGPLNAPMAVHKVLLEKEIVLLEGIVLKDVREGKYFLSALPLNIKGIEGSPCRAYLIKD